MPGCKQHTSFILSKDWRDRETKAEREELMLSIFTGAEDSELAPDLGHVSLTHRCGLGAHGVRGARGGRMLLTRMGPDSSFTNLLPTGPASEASGCCLRCIPHGFLTPHQPGRVGLEKGL